MSTNKKVEFLEKEIISLNEKIDLLIKLQEQNNSKYYTVQTLAQALNRSEQWVYKNKHLFTKAIVIIDPDCSKLQFSKKKIDQILESNSCFFRNLRV